MSGTGPSADVREQVLGRNGGLCLRCGWNRAEHVHHRKPRGAGGTKDPAINSPANLVGLCADDHRDVESHRTLAYSTGWLVARYRNPADVPLVTLTEQTLMLLDDGTYVLDNPYTDYWPEETA